jgi:enolase-phosphatase E1
VTPGSREASAILLDIEGTTTPITFVYDVLFPYARRRLNAYLADPSHKEPMQEALRRLRNEWTADADARAGTDGVVAVDPPGDDPVSFASYVVWLMDRDRKSPGLKLLQGRIWEEGYRAGKLKGVVFADVAPALRRWTQSGIVTAIYSSGSELAQRLLFGTTADGDLTPFFTRFFDTAVGAKQDADSYRRIARELGTAPDRVLFVSDVVTELDAAHAAGCQTVLCLRPGNRRQPFHAHRVIESLDGVSGM